MYANVSFNIDKCWHQSSLKLLKNVAYCFIHEAKLGWSLQIPVASRCATFSPFFDKRRSGNHLETMSLKIVGLCLFHVNPLNSVTWNGHPKFNGWLFSEWLVITYQLEVSKSGSTPKWRIINVYNGNSYWHGWYGGIPHFRKESVIFLHHACHDWGWRWCSFRSSWWLSWKVLGKGWSLNIFQLLNWQNLADD